ncbi:MAG: hypothetical protein HQL67_06495 [Magnetococcales bacterium]|nr:hypothetical protein [Magnetococcales bacterium]
MMNSIFQYFSMFNIIFLVVVIILISVVSDWLLWLKCRDSFGDYTDPVRPWIVWGRAKQKWRPFILSSGIILLGLFTFKSLTHIHNEYDAVIYAAMLNLKGDVASSDYQKAWALINGGVGMPPMQTASIFFQVVFGLLVSLSYWNVKIIVEVWKRTQSFLSLSVLTVVNLVGMMIILLDLLYFNGLTGAVIRQNMIFIEMYYLLLNVIFNVNVFVFIVYGLFVVINEKIFYKIIQHCPEKS